MSGEQRSGFPLIGIMGDGQLGRMMALAGIRMGLQFRFLTPSDSGPADGLGETLVGDWKDPAVLKAFLDGCSAVTVESEWAPAEFALPLLPEGASLWPHPDTLFAIRDKGRQKTILQEAGLPVPAFTLCATLDEAKAAAQSYGFPVLFKRFRGSYDGYGNATVRNQDQAAEAWGKLAQEDGLLVEAWAPFVRELAVLVARRPGGEHEVYPVVFTEQRDHRCHAVVVPAGIEAAVEAKASEMAVQAVEAVNGVGLTAVELFEMADGSILVNELAPRPHNTGHYTIEACHTSQFENHLRGVLDWPLGSAKLRVPAACMINVLGHHNRPAQHPTILDALQTDNVSVHIYGKREARPKRKMGHITVTGEAPQETRRQAEEAAAKIDL